MAFWNELPLVGGLLGGIFGNPEEEAHQKALQQARQDMYKYRPEAMDARMNAMGTMSHAFEPVNNMMGQAYGPGAQQDWSQLIKNPFSDEAIARMRQQANPNTNAGNTVPFPTNRPVNQQPAQQPQPQYDFPQSAPQQIGPDGRPVQGRNWGQPKPNLGGR